MRRFDYSALLSDWSSVFGQDALHPILLPDSVTDTVDLSTAFKGALADLHGTPPDVPVEPPRMNTARDAKAMQFIRLLNRAHGGGRVTANDPRRAFVAAIDGMPVTSKFRPTRQAAQACVAHYADSNEAVRATYFPQRQTLFHDDFSMYPTAPLPELTADEVAAIALQARSDNRPAPRGKRARSRRARTSKA